MKTSAVLLVAAGVAVVAYVALNRRPSISTTGKTALQTQPKDSRDALERGAIELGTQLGTRLIDTFFGARKTAAPDGSASIGLMV